ncbi:FAD-linked oxidase C-terminal domain-containing protein [Schlesneria paludicola]|uniref:FAD-linked oxidase C-terminal domain-containing protein n=1 Tax=Schlesneria paludicola TaxID=360056 RepID=UPI00029B1866|nr:FAD-linked oxidase C-terminal domain-containing protein [Schlesneria paludicola]
MATNRLEGLLKQSVVRGRVLTAPAQLAGYDADGLGYKTFRPDAVVIPSDADEMIRVLQSAKQLGVPICVRGAGTSLSGGPVAAQGGVIVHTSALRNVRKIDVEGFWCEVECGVTLNRLDEILAPHGVFYPPDPSSGPVCTLGGNIAMNAGGAHCFRYGVTSNYVLGVEAVLLDGSVHRFGGPAGGRGPWREDWKRFMVGSEGTLGAFTRFWLRLLPRPEKVWTFRATYSDLITAEKAIHALVTHSSFPVAIELMDPRCVAMVENSPMAAGLPKDSFMLLTEIDGPPALVDARVEAVADILRSAGSRDVVFSDDDEQRKKLWKARKAAGGLMGQLSADFMVQDAVIPKRALAELLQLVYDEADAAGIRAVNVFHAGDGNLHPNFLFDSRNPGELEKVEHIGKRLMQRVVDVGGTLSGEHGIGNDKSAYMPLVFGTDALRLQLAVPAVFNPHHQLNPLKVFAERRFEGLNGATQNGVTPDDKKRVPSVHETGQSVIASTTAVERYFEPFLDPIDGVLCLSAESTATDVEASAAAHKLRFPLLIDRTATLRVQVNATGFAPASSRFGAFCDNIVGMNWKLPNGRTIRVGERVVKTTTGYDLFRFLLASGDRFGHPIDYVLRLRPDCGPTTIVVLKGSVERVSKAIPDVLRTCWMHWFDSIDFISDQDASSAMIRIVVNGPIDESPVAERYLTEFAQSHTLSIDMERNAIPPTDGLPDFAFKTATEHVIPLAREIAKSGVRCVALCYNGVVHGFLDDSADRDNRIRTLINAHGEHLMTVGGDWHSRHLPDLPPSTQETQWITAFEHAADLLAINR